MSLAKDIKQKAVELGFDIAGITDASPIGAGHVQRLTDWLKSGCAGQMSYMHENFEKRIDPAGLLENAQSVICLGLNYKPPEKPIQSPDHTTPAGRVASYAQYQDYHSFIKKQLRKLTNFITSIAGAGLKFKICVDSAPLAEKALAARAGLGFIGKNHLLINPQLGPQILLGEIITSLKLQPDEPIKNNCLDCTKCLTACPTGALQPDGRLDANKCISYLTIEYKGQIPHGLAEKIGDRLIGCDECLLACPYQQNAPLCKNKQFKFYSNRARLNLHEILSRGRPACLPYNFEAQFADSPIKRLSLERLKRNAQICLTNITR